VEMSFFLYALMEFAHALVSLARYFFKKFHNKLVQGLILQV